MNSLDRLIESDAAARLRARDPSLFSDDADVQGLVADRLGWTHLASESAPTEMRAVEIARDLVQDGMTDVLLLGMGGSSLAALVMAEVLGTTDGPVRLHVLDTTSPTTVTATLAELDPETTAAIVASKSGTTIEPLVLLDVTNGWLRDAGVTDVASHLIAITDPGSSLEARAHKEGFRAIVNAPSDVGGRYSALTAFGLVPAAIAGVDLAELLARARIAERQADAPPIENPGAGLAAFMGDAHASGADKLTLVMSPALRPLGLWIEQLVAESTGKSGVGVLPVIELAEEPAGYGADRAVAVVRLGNDALLAEWARRARSDHPLVEIELSDRYDLGAEFVSWEHAIALVGVLLGINPFDEPNVAEAKKATSDVLAGDLSPLGPNARSGDVALGFHGALEPPAAELSLADALATVTRGLSAGDYLAVLAYLPDDDRLRRVESAIPSLAAATRRAVAFDLGPRYLHSTGQLHKGGPPKGSFVVITSRDTQDVVLGEHQFTLAGLHEAQAQGDVITLAAHDRPVLHIELPDSSPGSIGLLADALADDALKTAEHVAD